MVLGHKSSKTEEIRIRTHVSNKDIGKIKVRWITYR